MSLSNYEQCMPHVMHLFLSPGEGGEFVGWQGRHMRSFTIHIIIKHTLQLALLLSSESYL